MKIKLNIFILFFGLLTIIFATGYAGSYYNSRGLGDLKYISNAQAIGMGGSVIAVPDIYQINSLNPAGLVFIPITRMGGDLIHEAIWSKDYIGDGFSKYTNLNGISLAIPIVKTRLVSSLGIIPSTRFNYEYDSSDVIEDHNYTKKIIASGGLNKISFGFGGAINKYIYLGGYFHYNFGKLEQNWKVDFASDLFWDSSDKITRKMWGVNWSAGMIVRPISSLYVGAVYSWQYKLTVQDQVENSTQKGSLVYFIDILKSEKKKLCLPELLGLGLTYVLKEKYRFSGDLVYQPWTDFKKDNQLITDFNDSYRFGIGIEMLPSKNMLAKYHQKMTYRMGYFFQQLNFQAEGGNAVSEHGASVGIGFPYYGSLGRIDVAFRYSMRGDISTNPVEEKIFQFFISVSGGERWFNRTR